MRNTFMACLAAAAIAPAYAAIPPNIQLDPYCDQMLGLTPNGAGGVYGTWAELTPCGVGADVAAGGVTGKAMLGGRKGYALNTDSYPSYGTYYFFVINANGTWYVVDTFTGSVSISSTWSPVVAGVKPTGKSLRSQLAR